jgi:hypothetical protein
MTRVEPGSMDAASASNHPRVAAGAERFASSWEWSEV